MVSGGYEPSTWCPSEPGTNWNLQLYLPPYSYPNDRPFTLTWPKMQFPAKPSHPTAFLLPNLLHEHTFLHPLCHSYSFFQIQVSFFLRGFCLIQVQVELYNSPLNSMKSYDFQTRLLLTHSFCSRLRGIKESSGLSLLSHQFLQKGREHSRCFVIICLIIEQYITANII